jgi:hypothetical protein
VADSILDILGDGYFETIVRVVLRRRRGPVLGESPIEPHAYRHWFEMQTGSSM